MAKSSEGGYFLAGREMSAPLFNAAGAINHFDIEAIKRDARLLAASGVGAIQYGSVTIPESPGNEVKYGSPTHYYDEKTGEMVNSKGLPNPGKEVFLKHSKELVDIAHDAGKLAILSASATNGEQDSVAQTVQLLEEFMETDFDILVANTSCPNIYTDGEAPKPIMGYDYEAMDRMVQEIVVRIGYTDRLAVKPANHDTDERKIIVPHLAQLFIDYPVFVAMEGPNTIPGYVILGKNDKPVLSVPGGAGGLSGPATRNNGREQQLMWQPEIGSKMDYVRTQGLDSGKELAWSLGHDAVAGSGVSFLWNSEKSWPETVDDFLRDFEAVA